MHNAVKYYYITKKYYTLKEKSGFASSFVACCDRNFDINMQ